MALEGGEVNVGDEKDGLGLEVCHHFEDGHVVALLEDGHFHIHDWRGVATGTQNKWRGGQYVICLVSL